MAGPLEDENTPLYTVGQVAQLLAVKQAFLRRCDELRVVTPQRSAGGQRRYTRIEISVIQQVVTMADEGMTLPAIRRIIDLERQLAQVTMQRDELARRLTEISRSQAIRREATRSQEIRSQETSSGQPTPSEVSR
jgi:MerR family transcriptional regulator, heat shock protein HspR